MRNSLWLPGAIILAFLTCASSCEDNKKDNQPDTNQVKILTYNVKNCTGMDGKVNYQRIADIIKHVDPDIVALQELDSATQRSKGIVVLNELARMTGMYQTYGASIAFQGGKYGIGLLTRSEEERNPEAC
jgi:endonuclease/exonuclease/phosphatase family metal-dependent hydrolase